MPKISLVICTYNRSDILPRCLAAAARQTLPASEYEILVVDNASSDNTAAVVRRFIAGHPGRNIRYVHHTVKGLSHARNAGALAAQSPIVYYIDDDAIAYPHAVSETLRVFDEHPDAGVVGGRIRAVLPDHRPHWYSSHFDGYFAELNHAVNDVTRCSETWQYPYGANIAYAKQALAAVGYFNASFGRIGHNAAGGEEIDCTLRVVQGGYSVYYTPFAIVDHAILPHRLQWSYIKGSARAAGRNWAYYDIELLGSPPNLRSEFGQVVSRGTRVWRTVLGRQHANYYVTCAEFLFQWSKFKRKCHYVVAGLLPRQRTSTAL